MTGNGGRQGFGARAALLEANALLGTASLHGGDVRWLSGELVDVLINPLPGPDGERAMILSFALRHQIDAGLEGARVEITDAQGWVQRAALDADGHVRLSIPTGTYQVLVRPPPAPPAAATALSRSDPCPPRPAARRRRPREPARFPKWIGAAAVVTAALCVAAGTLVIRSEPAFATVDLFTAGCRETSGTSTANHVVVAAVWAGKEQDRFRQVLQRFKDMSGFDVTFATNLHKSDRNLTDTINNFIDKGCPPDVALLPQPGLLHQLAAQGHALPLDDIAGDLIAQNYTRAWQEEAQLNGRSYGVWFKGAEKSIIWYDANAFKKAGIAAPPTSWTGLKDVASRLEASGITPFSLAGKDGWTLTDWFENVYLRMWGSDDYDKLVKHQMTWTDPSVKAALAKLAEIFDRPDWLAGGTRGALNTTYEDSVSQVFGTPSGPRAAMVFEGGFVANEIAKTHARVGVDARYFDFPAINDRGGGAAVGGDIAVLLHDTPAARRFVRFLATPQAAEPWVQAGGFISPNTKIGADQYPDLLTRHTVEALLGNNTPVLFDLSDLQNPAFGANPGRGMQPILQRFLAHPGELDAVSARLEAAWLPPISGR